MTTDNQNRIDFDGETFSVDAALIGESLGIEPALVQPLMRAGKITSRCERGIDQDAGRYRLTFFHDHRQLNLVIDEAGAIVTRSVESTLNSRRRALRAARGRRSP